MPKKFPVVGRILARHPDWDFSQWELVGKLDPGVAIAITRAATRDVEIAPGTFARQATASDWQDGRAIVVMANEQTGAAVAIQFSMGRFICFQLKNP